MSFPSRRQTELMHDFDTCVLVLNNSCGISWKKEINLRYPKRCQELEEGRKEIIFHISLLVKINK